MGRLDKRKSIRRMTSAQAQIVSLDRARPGLICTVLDMSRTGARLSFRNPRVVPDRFILVVPDQGVRCAGLVAWRSASEIGVRFVADDRRATPVSERSFGKRPTPAEGTLSTAADP